MTDIHPPPDQREEPGSRPPARAWQAALLFDLLFIAVLLLGAHLRCGFELQPDGGLACAALRWDEGTYLHPDERFLAIVESKLEPVQSFSEYWNTGTSTLNPNNKGEGFFVYGTLPIFLVRYVMEAAGRIGYGDVAVIGRPMAGLFDLLTIAVLYAAARRLYGRRVALLAAAFSALAVLQIQLSHFFTVDIFANVFIWAALYFGIRIAGYEREPATAKPQAVPAAVPGSPEPGEAESEPDPLGEAFQRLKRLAGTPWLPLGFLFAAFGVMSGAAVASKVSAAPVVLILPLAAFIYYSRRQDGQEVVPILALLGLAGFLSALTFRVFQPYAFTGPGFFGIVPNPHWLETLGRLRELVEPSSGYPPSVQWFDRPLWFSGWNMTAWGLGLPLGIAAWIGFVWMGLRMLRGEWRAHLVIWAWVGGHFLWQSFAPNPTMRYQLPIYPGMALMAAWGLTAFWDWASGRAEWRRGTWTAGAGAAATLVLALTLAYAVAFTSIYRSDHAERSEMTRLEASRWIYDNLPGAFTLEIQTAAGEATQLLSFPNGHALRPGEPFNAPFTPRASGTLTEVLVPHIDPSFSPSTEAVLFFSLFEDGSDQPALATTFASLESMLAAEPGGPELLVDFGTPVPVRAGTAYRLHIELVGMDGTVEVCRPFKLFVTIGDGASELNADPPLDCVVSSARARDLVFTMEADGLLHSFLAGKPENVGMQVEPQTVTMELWDVGGIAPLATAALSLDGPVENAVFALDAPVNLVEGAGYRLALSVDRGSPLSFSGAVLAQESSWDDPLPMRVEGYDGYGGIYRGENNLELYWPDDQEKVDRFVRVLDSVDIIPISSSRQWASLTRLPARWPLVQTFYRELMGCPAEMAVETCFNIAEPGMFTGRLGFELVRTFQSNPTLFGVELNDQASEEAFTVYDHPKVFIFAKTAGYDPVDVYTLFRAVDLPGPDPGAAQDPIKPLTLSEERRQAQAGAGTWTDLYSPDSPLNRSQPLAVLAWYVVVLVLGAAFFPVLALALPGLDDRGYPFARIAALLFLAYITWLPGSYGLPVTRPTLTIGVALIVLLGGIAYFYRRDEMRMFWREKRAYLLSVEALALGLFLAMLVIRMANPDLWHPWKGGEKPMDFAYFNAVLKSINFPPYDPWFAGGYINYYYYGYVIVGTLVKWLGIVPAVAYNLVIPTLFMMVGIGAFSIGWNLVETGRKRRETAVLDAIQLEPVEAAAAEPEEPAPAEPERPSARWSYLGGLAAAAGVAILGNLGSVRMIWQGYQRVAAPAGTELAEAFFLSKWFWGLQGFIEVLSTDAELPYALADWYWFPSRAIPAPGDIEPITEFPFFTFLYGDLHAHMIALPVTLLALAWALAVVLGRFRWTSLPAALLSFFIGGLTIGALRPTNTWDYPTYLALGVLAVVYAGWKRLSPARLGGHRPAPIDWLPSVLTAAFSAALLALLSWFLYQPYTESYALGYTDINIWQNTHTSLSAYLTHWGLFLFVIVAWMSWETREWLAETPAAAGLRFLQNRVEFIAAGLLAALAVTALLLYLKVSLGVYLVPLLGWAGLLLFRPGISDRKRAVLFMVGTGIFLTAMVETIVLSGDIGRMNTVFKFYLQVWVLFALSAAAALGWLLPETERWLPAWNRGWRLVGGLLLAGACLYPLLAGFARMKDRVSEEAPVTLDGMAYMPYANYFEADRELRFDEDYRAIRWMQENVEGTPVIVEGQVVEYRWGARYSIYTGLPTVLGWNWHQRQQRTGHDQDVWDRDIGANGVDMFYDTINVNQALDFLNRYHVEYIIVGQMERAVHGGPGIDKFETYDGRYWVEVYRDGETVIYRVVH